MEQYNVVTENNQSTLVSELEPNYNKSIAYQSEAELEKKFIKQLQQQAYEYLPINSEEALIDNLRLQLEKLNDYSFTDDEWKNFFNECIANKNRGIAEKTQIIQENYIQVLHHEDGSFKNIYLIDKNNIHNNRLQVINQYVADEGIRDNRYDVTILINGLPLVHVELKRRGVDIKEAFNQINRYNRESFWSGCGLFEYVQLFVISNGTQTKYYSNTTRVGHITELSENGKKRKAPQTSNSYEFTSYWATSKNKIIPDLEDFTKTFFAKITLLNILTKYCIFTSEKLLLVMRPYQIAATEAILSRVNIGNNYKNYGKPEGGGYIWHTTGSGKTLTSFKTARLVSQLPFIDKVLFVVDRKDLDYQTMKEYDKFEKGAANSNSSTSILKKQLEDPSARIIITTIQKLSNFLAKFPKHEIYNSHIVMIFDECHRSQFGDMHTAITKKFNKYHLFGFTGTPIMEANASSSGKINLKTTQQAFGDCLHTYTIVDAISDGNVLPFRVEYISTIKEDENIPDEQVYNIDREKALMAPERISKITSYILDHFDQKTKRNSSYKLKERRINGFNSIFATSSITAAKLYYAEFKKQMSNLPSDKRLKVALIFSYGANEAVNETGLPDDENSESTSGLDASSRDFLEDAIRDYNLMFGKNFDTSSDKFQNYYKDVSERMKNRDLDLLIVVNMFLTGFDATTLNTLWVDKNLRMHGLLQAFSRTNRILNSIKTFGNIVCFRDLENATNESIALFGDKEAGGIVTLRTFAEYLKGYIDDKGKRHKGYEEYVNELIEKYPLDKRIMGEENEKDFIRLYGTILKSINILSSFDDFKDNEMLSKRDMQDYHSIYIDLYDKYRKIVHTDSVDITDDIVFEMELIKMVEINIDYILDLISKFHKDHTKESEIELTINRAINSSPNLRNKKDLIETFIRNLNPESNINDDWSKFVKKQEKEELDKIIEDENLKMDKTYNFIHNSFRDGEIQTQGTSLVSILPPVSRFSKNANRTVKRNSVIEKLKNFFNRFWDISGGVFDVDE